jgi:3-deoxy-D-manno-octulosonic-acid transferase
VFGPSMFNFAEAAQLALQAGAAVQVTDAREAIGVARALLADQRHCTQMGLAGSRLCAAHRGATERHLETCGRLLDL